MKNQVNLTGRIFRYFRERNGLTQRQMASALGIDQAIICKIENGNRLPTFEQRRKLERYLQRRFVDLMKEFFQMNYQFSH